MINHLMYVDDIKLFVIKKKMEIMIPTIRIYSQDVGMEFGIKTCAILIMKSRKRETMEGIELPNQERIRTIGEKENNKYFGILEAGTIKQTEMK